MHGAWSGKAPLPLGPSDKEALRVWAQAKSLQPPPFPEALHACRALLQGLQRGDAQQGQLLVDRPLPDWLDVASVRRGQLVLRAHSWTFLNCYMLALLHGFCIGRFSQLLLWSGYASSEWETYARFRSTWLAIWSWGAYELFTDGQGPARWDASSHSVQQLLRVRRMHEMARRRVAGRWATYQGSHEPLSQYDMVRRMLSNRWLCASNSVCRPSRAWCSWPSRAWL
jgi:hypothetical protein